MKGIELPTQLLVVYLLIHLRFVGMVFASPLFASTMSPITMHLIRGKAFNKNRLAIASTSFMINMTVMGIWHGLTPNFIIYGMYHGVLLTLHEIIQSKWGFYKTHKNDRWFQVVEWVINFHLVMIGFLIFSNKGAHFFRNL